MSGSLLDEKYKQIQNTNGVKKIKKIKKTKKTKKIKNKKVLLDPIQKIALKKSSILTPNTNGSSNQLLDEDAKEFESISNKQQKTGWYMFAYTLN